MKILLTEDYDDLHEYAIILNERLEHIRFIHKDNNIRIIFNVNGVFSGFEMNKKSSQENTPNTIFIAR